MKREHAQVWWGGAFLFAGLIVATIVLGSLYGLEKDAGSKGGIKPPAVEPGLGNELSPAYDFPVWPQVQSWNISANHSRTLSFSTNASSWSALDLSPDGSLMVFDLLGDLYLLDLDPATFLPLGAPRLLLGGVAWTREPRFSPSGAQVVFASDESGVDNIWLLELASDQRRQLTHENFRWLSAPCFTADGASIIAVKWLYSTRSLGAGELWLYSATEPTPLNGGRLILGIATPNSQLGPEEPVADRQGLYLYYSQNVVSGTTFQYSQDVHQGLYSIFRRHLLTNATRQVAGSYGGAARPVISPDGSALAFVRRIEYQTCLLLRQLQSGNEQVLFCDLAIDLQDAYSPCGNYPNFAFTPNGQYILIWAQGRYLRVDVATGQVATFNLATPIDVNLQLTDPLRFPMVAADGQQFQTKVTNWASAWNPFPTSQVLAFTSVGRTYLRSFTATGDPSSDPYLLLPNSSPAQATQFAPTLDPQGRFVVHATWSDQQLGTLQLVTLSASGVAEAQYQLTTVPARYGTPVISPDGRWLAYSVFSANSLTGIQWPINTGIYVMAIAADYSPQTPYLVTTSGSTPRWLNATHLSILAGGYPRLLLRTYPISQPPHNDDGTAAITIGSAQDLAWSKYATDILVSPDSKHVAFIEFGWVYLAKFPAIKLPLEVSSRPGHIPASGVLSCATYGGSFLQWRLPSELDANATPLLSWLLGATWYQLRPKDVDDCWDNGAAATNAWQSPPTAQCVTPHTVAFDLSTVQATAVPAGDTLLCLTNVTIYTMRSRDQIDSIARGELHIRGELIEAILDLDSVDSNQTCTALALAAGDNSTVILDLQGHVVFPGFIDAHAHWSTESNILVQTSWQLMINLAFGVTTMFNPSASTTGVFEEAELARSGVRLSPRLLSTGTIIYGAGGPSHQEIDSLATAVAVLRRHQIYGAQAVKSYNQPQRYARQMILEAARQLQMNVVPEGGMNPAWDLTMLVDSHTTIEHNIPIILEEDAVQLWAFSATASTPTLIVCYGDLWSEIWGYQHEDVWTDPRVLLYTPAMPVMAQSMRRLSANDNDFYGFRVSQNVKRLADAGVTVEVGAHGQQQGIGYAWELKFFSQGGSTPYQVLFAATKGGANALDIQGVGEIAVGNLADLTIYPADKSPLLDISFARELSHVMRGGRLFATPSLSQIFPTSQPAPVPPVANTPNLAASS